MAYAYCPDCLARVDLSRIPKIGQLATCWCCRAALRVSDLNPLQLDWVAEAADEGWEEDWEVELERVLASRPRP
jgi:lysine biosynthesis protein LysW